MKMDSLKKRLIVNADDFGMHESINEAVEMAYKNGALTSASLMVNGDGFKGAIEIARRNRGLGVGLHLTLVGERPVAGPSIISTIVDRRGMLLDTPFHLLRRLVTGTVDPDHIATECEMQIRRCVDAGLQPTHLNSHQHLHLFPPVFSAIIPVLKKYNISKIRTLRIPCFEYRMGQLVKAVFALSSRYANAVKMSAFKGPDFFLGYFHSGRMDSEYFRSVLPRIETGITEINFHPGADDIKIKERYGFLRPRDNWPCRWEREFAALTDTAVKDAIRAHDISLVNYAEM